jgi:hypothetical protein
MRNCANRSGNQVRKEAITRSRAGQVSCRAIGRDDDDEQVVDRAGRGPGGIGRSQPSGGEQPTQQARHCGEHRQRPQHGGVPGDRTVLGVLRAGPQTRRGEQHERDDEGGRARTPARRQGAVRSRCAPRVRGIGARSHADPVARHGNGRLSTGHTRSHTRRCTRTRRRREHHHPPDHHEAAGNGGRHGAAVKSPATRTEPTGRPGLTTHRPGGQARARPAAAAERLPRAARRGCGWARPEVVDLPRAARHRQYVVPCPGGSGSSSTRAPGGAEPPELWGRSSSACARPG